MPDCLTRSRPQPPDGSRVERSGRGESPCGLEQLDEGLGPHAVRRVWLIASADVDVFVDIAPTFERKVAARLDHARQTTDPDAPRGGWQLRLSEIGAPAGLYMAESFTLLDPA